MNVDGREEVSAALARARSGAARCLEFMEPRARLARHHKPLAGSGKTARRTGR